MAKKPSLVVSISLVGGKSSDGRRECILVSEYT